MGNPVTLSPWTPASASGWIARRVDIASRSRVATAYAEVAASVDSGAKALVVAHEDNAAYAGAWLAAASAGVDLYCANPKWSDAERAAAGALIPAGAPVVGGSGPIPSGPEESRPGNTIFAPSGRSGGIFIPTGGTGGVIRFVRHTATTLSAAVSGFSSYAGDRLLGSGRPAKLHAVQALPCCHVSGLMPVVRAWLTDAELVFTGPSFRPEEPLPAMPESADGLTVVSLVATQLHRLLDRADGPEWLRGAGLVLVGGSSVATGLLDRARAEHLPLGVSYGLTEAAALLALYPPDAFLAGEPVAGEVLPHIRVAITPEGRVALAGESLGANLKLDDAGRFVTGDEGLLDDSGRLIVTGRADRIVISGGEKIDPALVERAILASGLVKEVAVFGEPDAEWGKRLVAYYVGETTPELLAGSGLIALTGYRRPKVWVPVAGTLCDEKGKINRELLQRSRHRDV